MSRFRARAFLTVVAAAGWCLLSGTLTCLRGDFAAGAAPEQAAGHSPSPLDTLQRSQIPEYELKWAGGGDPLAAPRSESPFLVAFWRSGLEQEHAAP